MAASNTSRKRKTPSKTAGSSGGSGVRKTPRTSRRDRSSSASTADTPQAAAALSPTPTAAADAADSAALPKKAISKNTTSQKKVEKSALPTYDRSNLTAPFPVRFKLFARWKHDKRYHPCEILECAKIKDVVPEAEVETFHNFRYYVHFLEFDRRMDEWIDRDQMKFEEEIAGLDPSEQCGFLRIPDTSHDSDHGNLFSAEDHRAHEEATKVKNIDSIVLGRFEMETWYFSPFPIGREKYETVFFCEFCLNFFIHLIELERHIQHCSQRHPPGHEIYRSDEQNCQISVFEVDGSKEIIYCQNLCLIAKLFLDHKTLQYDTEAFIFYVVTEVDEMGCHLAGYFSKEKEPEQQNNLACILTLPCHQRKGYGKFLMSLSYALSRIEGRPGSPEKPLSDLGRIGYESYWARELVGLLHKHGAEIEQISIDELSRQTGILQTDVKDTLERLNVIRYEQGEHILHISDALIQKYLAPRKVDPSRVHVGLCQEDLLHYTPFILAKGRKILR